MLALALTRTKIALLCLAGGLVAMALWFGRRHPWQMALAGCSLAMALVLAEVGLRLFYPQISQHDAMFQPDPVLGWRFIPGHSGSIVYAGEVHHFISTNASGFRGEDPATLPPHGRRVLVMGDSFVSNISVGEQDVFTAVMQQRLGDTTVVNLGVNGYGVVQEYLLLQQWCDRVKPDLVVLMIYTRNAERSAELAEQIAQRWPALNFRLAQSVEPQLSAEESWAGVPARQLQQQVERWRVRLQPVGVTGIDWQDWSYYPH